MSDCTALVISGPTGPTGTAGGPGAAGATGPAGPTGAAPGGLLFRAGNGTVGGYDGSVGITFDAFPTACLGVQVTSTSAEAPGFVSGITASSATVYFNGEIDVTFDFLAYGN